MSQSIFTRYLYVKNDVIWSLFYSISWKNIDESLFWAYELYYSGFQDEVFAFLQFVYDECYSSKNASIVRKRLQKIYEDWKEAPNNDWLLATYLVNILYREHDILAFIKKYDYNAYIRESAPHEILPTPNRNPNPKKIVFVNFCDEDIKQYKTVIPSNKMKASQILGEVCKYVSIKDGPEYCQCLRNTVMEKYMELPYSRDELDTILKSHSSVWLYYASATPIWMQRIQSHKANINHDAKKIEFVSELMRLAFLNKYGYL